MRTIIGFLTVLTTLTVLAQTASAGTYSCSNSKGDSATISTGSVQNEIRITSSSISSRAFVCDATTMKGNRVNCDAWQDSGPMVDHDKNMMVGATADVGLFDGTARTARIDFDTLSESLICNQN